MCSPIGSKKFIDINAVVHTESLSIQTELPEIEVSVSTLRRGCPNELIRRDLVDKEILDVNGESNFCLPPLEPFLDAEIQNVINELTTSFDFVGTNGFKVSMTPWELLRAIQNEKELTSMIDSSFIVGGGVNKFFTRPYIERNVKKIEKYTPDLSHASLSHLTGPSRDLDVRIKLIPECMNPSVGKKNHSVYETLRRCICRTIAKKCFFENPTIEQLKFVWDNAFVKRKSETEPVSFSVVALQTLGGWRLEIFSSDQFPLGDQPPDGKLREYLFISDAIAVPVHELLSDVPLRQITLKTYACGGMRALLAKLTKITGCIHIETMNQHAFLAQLSKEICGYTDPYLNSMDGLVEKFCNLYLTTYLKEQKNISLLDRSSDIDRAEDESNALFFYFQQACKNHADNDGLRVFFLTISFVYHLEGRIDQKSLDAFLIQANKYLKQISGEKSLPELVDIIMNAVVFHNISMSLVKHILAYKCYLLDMSQTSAPGLRIVEKRHVQQIVMQIDYFGSYLLLPYDPLLSIKCMQKNPLAFENAPDLLNIVTPDWSSTSEASTLQDLPIDSQSLLNASKQFLASQHTFKLGFTYLLANVKNNSTNANCCEILMHLHTAFRAFGESVFDSCLVCGENNIEFCSLLQIVKQRATNLQGEADFDIEYLDALINFSASFRFVGWRVYDKISDSDMPRFNEKLFMRILPANFPAALQLYNKMDMEREKKEPFLQRLLQFSLQSKDKVNCQLMTEAIETWLARPPVTLKETNWWLKGCHLHCKMSDLDKSFVLWKNGAERAEFWAEKKMNFKDAYHKYLLDFIVLLSQEIEYENSSKKNLNSQEGMIVALSSYFKDERLKEALKGVISKVVDAYSPVETICIFAGNSGKVIFQNDLTFQLQIIHEVLTKFSGNFPMDESRKSETIANLIFILTEAAKNSCDLQWQEIILGDLLQLIDCQRPQDYELKGFAEYILTNQESIFSSFRNIENIFSAVKTVKQVEPSPQYHAEALKWIFKRMHEALRSGYCPDKIQEVCQNFFPPIHFPNVKDLPEWRALQKSLTKSLLELSGDSNLSKNTLDGLELSFDFLDANEQVEFCFRQMRELEYGCAIHFLKKINNKDLHAECIQVFQHLCRDKQYELLLQESQFFTKCISEDYIAFAIPLLVSEFTSLPDLELACRMFKAYRIMDSEYWVMLLELINDLPKGCTHAKSFLEENVGFAAKHVSLKAVAEKSKSIKLVLHAADLFVEQIMLMPVGLDAKLKAMLVYAECRCLFEIGSAVPKKIADQPKFIAPLLDVLPTPYMLELMKIIIISAFQGANTPQKNKEVCLKMGPLLQDKMDHQALQNQDGWIVFSTIFKGHLNAKSWSNYVKAYSLLLFGQTAVITSGNFTELYILADMLGVAMQENPSLHRTLCMGSEQNKLLKRYINRTPISTGEDHLEFVKGIHCLNDPDLLISIAYYTSRKIDAIISSEGVLKSKEAKRRIRIHNVVLSDLIRTLKKSSDSDCKTAAVHFAARMKAFSITGPILENIAAPFYALYNYFSQWQYYRG